MCVCVRDGEIGKGSLYERGETLCGSFGSSTHTPNSRVCQLAANLWPFSASLAERSSPGFWKITPLVNTHAQKEVKRRFAFWFWDSATFFSSWGYIFYFMLLNTVLNDTSKTTDNWLLIVQHKLVTVNCLRCRVRITSLISAHKVDLSSFEGWGKRKHKTSWNTGSTNYEHVTDKQHGFVH